jgi:DNA-directed RNA polymerase specialized sigma subunit
MPPMSTELDLDAAYKGYVAEPTQQNLHKVVQALKPTINYQLASLGVSKDPVIRSKALVYTAQAIPKYNPEISTLPTYISRQLQRLTRDRRNRSTTIKIPERAQLEAFSLYTQEQEFISKHGREPDMVELSDFTGMPREKIEKIRDTMIASPTEGTFEGGMADSVPDFMSEATNYVYMDADHVDRKILELKTGYGRGSNFIPLKSKDIAGQLGISESQVSRRSLRLSKQIHEIKSALES